MSGSGSDRPRRRRRPWYAGSRDAHGFSVVYRSPRDDRPRDRDVHRRPHRALLRLVAQHRPAREVDREDKRARGRGGHDGLIGAGEEVTWRARHFGVWQRFTSRITEYDRPRHFRDEMQRGAFAHFRHDHDFTERDGKTLMTDTLDFAAPLGVLGRLAERAVLERYLEGFLVERNALLKRVAESEEWRALLAR
jgi:ligand-binding SRPBCC domain-containing protein